jgi:D-glycero-alpha-D-manno-heptose 1-phosphate guanylyltransferase
MMKDWPSADLGVAQGLAETESLAEIPALILAGGLGSRLQPAFSTGPKSMAPVNGQPFLQYLLSQISRAGFRKVVLCLGYGASQIKDWVRGGEKWDLRASYSVETEPAGTAGALRQARGLIASQCFLVFNGDSFLDINLRQLVQAHHRWQACATIALAIVRDPARYGAVLLGQQGEIKAFLEKGASAENGWQERYLINGGIYVFDKRVLELIPEAGAVSLERDIFPQLLARGVKGFVHEGYFIDIGVPDDFRRAQTELPKQF